METCKPWVNFVNGKLLNIDISRDVKWRGITTSWLLTSRHANVSTLKRNISQWASILWSRDD